MIPAYIMAVPWDVQRAKRANTLRKVTEGTVVWDQKQNAMDTFRLVLQAIIDGGDQGAFLMQDDVVLTENWRDRVEEVVAERPNQVVQFFSMGKNAPTQSGERDGKTFISNLCVYLPPGMASDLLPYSYEFVEKYPQFKTGDDFVIRYWLRNQRLKYWLQVPSLVQHETWVSAIHHRRPRNRVSLNFESGSSP